MTDEERPQRDDESEKQSFAGLRPGSFTRRGKMQPHEKRAFAKLAPIGLGIVVLIASPKPLWWPWWVTLAITGALFVLGVVIVVRGLEMPR